MSSPPDPDPRDHLGQAPEARPGRRTLPLLIGGGLLAAALVAGLAFYVFQPEEQPQLTEDNVGGGLQIELAQTEVGRIDPNRPLRCFVEGRFVGELTVSQCAERNGVPTGNLDVGLDDTGALAAVVSVGPVLEPLPETPLPDQAPIPAPDPLPPVAAAEPRPAPGGQCLRNAGGEWRNLGEGLALDTCVQVLFSGRCVGPGDALYGRWNGQSVRLVQGGVEMSDGAGYRPLVSQDPQTCLLP